MGSGPTRGEKAATGSAELGSLNLSQAGMRDQNFQHSIVYSQICVF